MSLGEWRGVQKAGLSFYRCPVCMELIDAVHYEQTTVRAAGLLQRARPTQPGVAIDTINRFAVAGSERGTVIVLPPVGVPLSQADALNLAAYLVAVSGARLEDFRAVFQAVVGA
jgi:hypothetical protein